MNTLLLIDANESLRHFILPTLESALPDLKVLTAESYQKALDLTEQYAPDIFVIDCLLPDGDGHLLIKEINRLLPDASVIMVSDELPSSLKNRGMTNGIFEILSKPYEVNDIISCLQRIFSQKNIESLKKTEPDQLTALPATLSYKDIPLDHHSIINKLAGLLAGLRAFGADLRSKSDDPMAVNKAIDMYLDRLVGTLNEVTHLLHDTYSTS